MPLLKLTLNRLIAGIVSLVLLGMLLFSGRVAVESYQKAKSLDEKLTNSTSPQLNKQALEKAYQLLVEPDKQVQEQPATHETKTSSSGAKQKTSNPSKKQ